MTYIFTVATNRVGSRIEEKFEVPDEDIAGKTPEQIDEYVADLWKEWVWENIDGSWGPA